MKKNFRRTPPPIQQVENIILPPPSVSRLSNGVEVIETRLGTQDIFKIEFVFDVGRVHEHRNLVHRATPRLLRDGTRQHSGAEIADILDFYAGTLQMPYSLDNTSIALFGMTKHAPALLPLLSEMMYEPLFPEKELATWVDNSLQRLAVDLTKNDVLVYRNITETLFGEMHPYGYNSTTEDYKSLTTADLVQHYTQHLQMDNCRIFLSGKTDDAFLNLVDTYFGQKIGGNNPQKAPKNFPESPKVGRYEHKIVNVDTVQTAIRIGRRIGGRQNPDFYGLFVLNTILGGYFGSRLMTNIREEKGYTYDISSAIDTMRHDGFWYIETEVGNEFVQLTLAEIYAEIEKLQTELVPSSELEMVRSYLLGTLLSMVDGPFAVSDVLKTLHTEGGGIEDFDKFVETVRTITPENLQFLAQKYFQKEDLAEVIAGV